MKEPTAFERFEKLTKAIVSVQKAEADKKASEKRRRKTTRKRRAR